MRTCDGLSLTEVLVSLAIVTSASLALIQQQCHIGQFTYQINHRNEAMLQLDNAAEQLMAHRRLPDKQDYQIKQRTTKQNSAFEVSINTPSSGSLKRWLVLG